MKILNSKYIVKGNEYDYITLTNKTNMTIKLSSLGAGIREVKVPDKNGDVKLITLSYTNDEYYNEFYHGKIIGRTSGRMENASFEIDGKVAKLEKNNKDMDNLHGGNTGLHHQNFDYRIIENNEYTDIIFNYLSPDGEGGYFGNIAINITYRIYEDIKNLLNITNHVYWNLSGDLKETILDHELYINADKRGVLNERSILTDIIPVSKEFDFRIPKLIGLDIKHEDVTLNTGGYDHPFYLVDNKNVVSSLSSKASGVNLDIKTSYPVVVFYSNNYPECDKLITNDKYDDMHMAVCLECQYSPNSVIMTPDKSGIFDKEYNEWIEYEFNSSKYI